GLFHATEIALQYCDFELKGSRVVIQGFGAVGKHAARFLTQKGAVLVGAADSHGTVYNPEGLDVDILTRLKNEGNNVLDYPDGKKLGSNEIVSVPCDIWIPAARPDVINEKNVHLLNTKLVVEGANIPITEGAEKILYEKGILYVPDFIANAGGVICAASEHQKATRSTAFSSIEEKVRSNTAQVLEAAKTRGILPREAALELAIKRVNIAMKYRRWSIFSSAPGFV
ncbi:MAG: glutamate dehydrogenase, partial [Euryarchaeota archaeon]|nr:glutamate dehydrogenase [Euryarchaeota archaeon]